jgi:uncharacterized protein (DUF2062 family)
MNPWLTAKQKVDSVIVQQLTQGLSAEKIALTIAVGLVIAINPVIGTTTIGCFVAAWALNLNQPIIQVINWSSYALQLLLIFPFIRLGEWIFRAPPERRTFAELAAMTKANPIDSLATLGMTILHAVVAWILVAPFVLGAVYAASLPLLRALAGRVAAVRAKGGGAASAPGPNDRPAVP